MFFEYVKKGGKIISYIVLLIIVFIAIKYQKYNLVLFVFMLFLVSPYPGAPFCNGNWITTRGIYTIIIIIMFGLNVNDVIGVITKENYESRDEFEKLVDYINVGLGILSSLLLIIVAFWKKCSIVYVIILILFPIVLIIGLIIGAVFSVFLGITGFTLVKYLPSSIKKLNDVFNIIPDPNKIITGKDPQPTKNDDNKDISISESTIQRMQPAFVNINPPDENNGSTYTSNTQKIDVSKSNIVDTSNNVNIT